MWRLLVSAAVSLITHCTNIVWTFYDWITVKIQQIEGTSRHICKKIHKKRALNLSWSKRLSFRNSCPFLDWIWHTEPFRIVDYVLSMDVILFVSLFSWGGQEYLLNFLRSKLKDGNCFLSLIVTVVSPEAYVWGRHLAGNTGFNPVGAWMCVSCNCCKLPARSLFDGPIPHTEST